MAPGAPCWRDLGAALAEEPLEFPGARASARTRRDLGVALAEEPQWSAG